VVAPDEAGKPSFNGLQYFGSSNAPIYFYAFDIVILAGRNLMKECLAARRNLLETAVLSQLREPSIKIMQSNLTSTNISELEFQG
jgi:ATP-dependent DNA ligase